GSFQRQESARGEMRAAVLARAGALVGSSLDYDRTLQGVADVVVSAGADRIAIDVVEDGDLRRVATAGPPTDPELAASVARTAEPILRDDTAVLPLRARDATVGALTLASAARPPAPDTAVLAFARELAAECATAIDNARL